ncbi:MAG: MBL fold metallo-hydrolase [Actinomycetota bacterium]
MTTPAELHVLQVGSGRPTVRSTVSLVIDGDQRIIIDPGMAPSQAAIADPLLRHGFSPGQVTDVIVSHHHPDHTVNVGMFPNARVHDHWAIYHLDVWTSRPAEGFKVSPAVTLWETPDHTLQDITTLVETKDLLAACTHLWFYASGPPDDPYAVDLGGCRSGRRRVLEVAGLIVPGHGPAFVPDQSTPR